MKKIYLIIFFGFHFSAVMSQPGTWTWMHGDSIDGSTGIFGNQGVASPANDPPGFYEPAEFRDLQGNFWLFGGLVGVNAYADLWKYEPDSNQWTWMKGPSAQGYSGNFGSIGVPSPGNLPPSLGFGVATWVDINGDFWMYGGFGPFGAMSDLWKYDPLLNEWTWIHGTSLPNQNAVYGIKGTPSPVNTPGKRFECNTTWVDAGNNLWLFGGTNGFTDLSDLWKYDPLTNEWTWMSGDSTGNQVAVYGTMGLPAPANTPGARQAYCHWKDGAGNFYFFGGKDSADRSYNDLWKYEPATGFWSWVSGTSNPDDAGSYGTRCVASVANIPPARYENRCFWTDSTGNFWLFGGWNIGGGKLYNDLWMCDPDSFAWAFISGDTVANSPAVFGALGVPSASNKPGPRFGNIGWISANGYLYMFGGRKINSFDGNDLWRYEMDPNCPLVNTGFPSASFYSSDTAFCEKKCIDFFDYSTNNPTSWQWLFPGADSTTSSQQNPSGICYNSYGSFDVTLIACNSLGCDTLTVTNLIHEFAAPPVPVISSNFDTLFSSTAYSYQWYDSAGAIPGAVNYYHVSLHPGSYYVVVTDSNGCAASSAIIGTGIPVLIDSGNGVVVVPNPNNGQFEIMHSLAGRVVSVRVYDAVGRIFYETAGVNQKTINLHVSGGLYFIEIITDREFSTTKFVVSQN